MNKKDNKSQNNFSNEEAIGNEETNINLDILTEEADDKSEETFTKTLEETENKDEGQDASKILDELKTLKEELAEYKDKYLRLSAEFQNYKRRTEKEKNEIYEFGSEKVIIDMLSVLDNLERAIDSANKNNRDEDGLLNGIQMIYRQFKDILSKHGVKEISSLKQKFDPNLHHAVIQEEVEGIESNIVLEVYEKGYFLKSKVIRPSMVKVSK